MTSRPISARLGLGAAALVALAAILRFYRIDAQEVWLDEAFSGLLVQRAAVLPLLGLESNPPLYWVLLKGFCSVFGTGPTALRALSALFSAAAVGAVTLYGARVFSGRFALGAGLFLALSPYSLYYGQEARAYSLLILLSLLCLLACYDAVVHKSKAAIWVFAVCVLAAGYSHYFVALTLLPLVLWLGARFAFNAEDRTVIKWLFVALAVGTGGCALWAAPSLLRQGALDPHIWIADQWNHLEKVWLVPRSLLVLLLGSARGLTPLFMKQWTALARPLGLVMLALSAYGLALAIACMARSHGGGAWRSRRFGMLLIAGVVLPLVVLFALSFIKPLYVVGRYDVIAFPYVVLLCGWIADRLGQLPPAPRAFGTAAGGIFLICLGCMDGLYFDSPAVLHDHDAAASARLLDEYVGDGDVLVFTGMRGPSVLYYLSARGYEWDGQYCRNRERQRVFECRVLPYTDTGVPFVMGGTVTTPVTADSAVRDCEFIVSQQRRPTVWLVVSRQVDPINEKVNRHLDVLLSRHRYAVRGLPPNLRIYQLLKYQPY